MKKTRLAMAMLAVSLSLVGCIGDDEEQQAVTETYVGFEPVVPAGENRSAIVPFPFDAFFAGAKTPTLNIPNAKNSNLVVNANMLDGFSTTASWFIDIFGMVDVKSESLIKNLMIVETNANPNLTRVLKYGEDYTIESSTVSNETSLPISAQRTRLLIEPLKPLAPSTTYLVALKKGVKTLDGGMVAPSYMFKILNSDTKVTENTDLYLKNYSSTEKATLESLRSQIISPVVAGLKQLGIPQSELLLAYSVTTQSTTKTMDKLAAMIKKDAAGAIAAVPINQTVAEVLTLAGQKNLPPNSDQTNVYVGTVTVPYYGDISLTANSLAVATSYWKADANQADNTSSLLGKIPCGLFAAKQVLNGMTLEPSVSTTACFPLPVKQSDQTIPMIVTVPKGAKPDGGWPVVIFQHGIGRNRTDVFAVASTYAKAGFATVAIDLPLHGLSAKIKQSDGKEVDNKFYKNSLLAGSSAAALMTSNERTFDVDIFPVTVDATGKFVGTSDGVVDISGAHFINLINPISSRDNLRQGASDILVLAKNLANLNLDNVAGSDINTNKVYLSSISLGTIVGAVALGADKEADLIKAASVSVGGGAIAKLLDGSQFYGPIITNGLAAAKVAENTDDYETFMRFAQTVTDSGDPINFAKVAKMNRPIHFTQVLNDLVVPNAALKGEKSATQDLVGATGFLSGNTALAQTMGFSIKNEIDITNFNSQKLTGANTWVQFNQGGHGSLLDPSNNSSVTAEMQCQSASFFGTASFFGAAGAEVQVGCSKP